MTWGCHWYYCTVLWFRDVSVLLSVCNCLFQLNAFTPQLSVCTAVLLMFLLYIIFLCSLWSGCDLKFLVLSANHYIASYSCPRYQPPVFTANILWMKVQMLFVKIWVTLKDWVKLSGLLPVNKVLGFVFLVVEQMFYFPFPCCFLDSQNCLLSNFLLHLLSDLGGV